MRDATPGVRAFVEPTDPKGAAQDWRPRTGWRSLRYGERVVIVDTETHGVGQALLVGGYVVAKWTGTAYERGQEGIVLGDGLRKDVARLVRSYAKGHRIHALTRTEFAHLLIQEGYGLGSLIVGFNLGFDLGALIVPGPKGWARGRKRYRHGFLLRLTKDPWRPGIHVLAGDDPKQFIQWSSFRGVARYEGKGRRAFAGRFLDLRRWAYMLWGKKLSLEHACEWAGTPYQKREVRYGRISENLLDYLREDVDATWRLFLALREEWNRLPFTPIPSPALPPRAGAIDTPDLSPDAILAHRMQSAAGTAKGLLKRWNVRVLLQHQPDVPRDLLGLFMSTLHGGWTEAHIQRTIVPVRLLDISSTYLTMAVLLHLWDVIAADRLDVVDDTPAIQAWLGSLHAEDLLRPETWARLLVVCEVEPADDVLPIQTRPSRSSAWVLEMNRVHAAPGTALWWALPDVLASWVRTGRVPRIRRAWRVVPRGRQAGLRSLSAWGFTFDPMADPLRMLLDVRRVIGERLAAARNAGDVAGASRLTVLYRALKATAEPLGYGVYAEVGDYGTTGEPVQVWSGGLPMRARSLHGERPGPYLNPFVAPFPPAACRLVMALMEAAIRALGGTWATSDTDSFAVVATETGGLIPCPGGAHQLPDGAAAVRALSYADVDALRARFDTLAPCGGPFWKVEPENVPHPEATRDRALYALVPGPKRFVFANLADDGRVLIRRASAHSLGHLVPPTGHGNDSQIAAVWEAAFRQARGDRKALQRMPNADVPAVARVSFTRPTMLLTVGATGTRPGRGLPRPFGFGLAVPVEDPLTGGDAYPDGWCRRDKAERRGCPDLDAVCRFRAQCPLAHPIRVLAPFDPQPTRWTRLPWRNLRTWKRQDLAWDDPEFPDGRPQPRTYLDIARAHFALGDPRYLGPDGQPGHMHTRGEVCRQDVRLVPHPVYGVTIPLGKQNRRIEDARSGFADRTRTVYEPDVPEVDVLRAWCQRHPVTAIAHGAQVARFTIERFRDGTFATLDPATRQRLFRTLLHLDAAATRTNENLALLRASLQTVSVSFLCAHTKFSRNCVYKIINGQTQRVFPETRQRLWQAYVAWVAMRDAKAVGLHGEAGG
ncbi:MAG TPA: hypothetical protein VKZ50_01430 [bacterium]|nr:hypothetical protein [bacterium]